jgi:hypothetical protein
MDHSPPALARAVLQALADLAPSTEQRASGLAVPTEWFRWLPVDSVRLFAPGAYLPIGQRFAGLSQQPPAERGVTIDRQFGERLAAVDQIRAEQRSLRLGWLFVAGRTTTDEGRTRRVFHPLVTIPVRVRRPPALGKALLLPAGDAEISELVTDRDLRHQLEGSIELGGGALEGITSDAVAGLLPRLERLQRYARSLAAAAGLPASQVVPAGDGPDALMRAEGLVIVAGVGVYAISEPGESSRASSLRAWSEGRLDRTTAFHSLYDDLAEASTPPARAMADGTVESPYVLTPVQREAVVRSRLQPITLVSGAPGTGKSHTIVAIACDALARGQRVLLAAKSDATVDALLDLLDRGPGPDPVVFGSNERREALANRLSAGQLRPEGDEAVAAAGRRSRTSASRRDALRADIADQLRAEALLDQSEQAQTEARLAAPGLFLADADLERAGSLLSATASPATGWLARRRRRKAQRELTALLQVSAAPPAEDMAGLLAMARAARTSAVLRDRGGLDLAPLWGPLLAADNQARRDRGTWLETECRSEQRLNRSTLPAVAALATALRSGRAARRDQLSRLDDDKLTHALPLWVGTLADVDDLLPPVTGLFDLVILDEASSIDQPLAATALLRGRRAVIAGDPRQLRQVSFVSDAQLRAVVAAHGLAGSPGLAARLDVRRNSTFDLAAGVTPVLVLDEHFRSDPHLVDFVARRLYDGKVRVATRSPRTESRDCVDIVRTQGGRDTNGVVRAEVDRVVVELKARLAAGDRSVGVVTPFRAQADALEEAVLAAFSADDLEALDLRVGTVHAFQGNERDVVIASVGIGPEQRAASWRFVEDPHLFAVFMTRARRRMTILCSAEPPAGGLVAAYLAQADSPPGPPKPAGTVGPWTTSIAEDLASAGLPILTAYPTGRHLVDVCVDDPFHSVGIECGVHPDGPEAHIDRHLALTRTGWHLLDAYRSRWGDRRGELIVDLLELIKTGSG